MFSKDPFDALAQSYDLLFTNSETGKAQREIVRRFVKQRIYSKIEILEVNCGTGEDAFYFASFKCNITATDASKSMIRIAEEKRKAQATADSLIFKQVSIQELDLEIGTKKFDLIFSNFSGLNCLNPNELKEASAQFHSFLNPGGKMIFILFGTNCLWEKFYYFLKGKKKEINRRNTQKQAYAQLLNSRMPVYYYSPEFLGSIFSDYFQLITIKPVGLFIPPTYLDPFFYRRKIFFRILTITDRLFESLSFLSNLADHYLVEFKKIENSQCE